MSEPRIALTGPRPFQTLRDIKELASRVLHEIGDKAHEGDGTAAPKKNSGYSKRIM